MALNLIRPLASVALASVLIGCATNPVTGRRQLALISEAQEIEIGRSAAAEVGATIGLVSDRELQTYVQQVGQVLARTSHRAELPWSFAVVDDPTPNAFALPGGFIFVTRGLMNVMNSEAELASVLGHEIGHVTARHSVSAISRQQLAQLGLGLGGIFFPAAQPFGEALSAGLGLLFLKHGRDAEREADKLGFEYALEHRYAVREMADVFAALERVGDEQRSALPAWLSTHPGPAERMKLVQQWIATLPPQGRGSRTEEAEYLGQIDGLVYGSNPRHGFFRGGVFFHPELRFRLDMPPEWTAQNLTDAVIGLSPARDAAVQLTLAADADPLRAAQRFAAQRSVRVLGSSGQRVSGLPAQLTAFDALTDQGTVRGLAAHLVYQGRTYQIVAYTPQHRFARYQPQFERVIASFAPLTDPAALQVQPNRIDIVRLPRAMTLAQFNDRYRSAVSLAELAILNQADGPDTQFAAGALLKRVSS